MSDRTPQVPGHLADALRAYRRRAGLTQRQAADLAGVSVASLRDLEQSRVSTPRTGTLHRLSTALELTDDELDELIRLGAHSRSHGHQLWLQLLGPLVVHVAGEPVDLGSARQRTLLSLLALSPNTPVSRDTLIDIAWAGQPPRNAGELLQTNISRLRRRLVPRDRKASDTRLLVATQGGYQLNVTRDQLDLLQFRELAGSATAARKHGDLAQARKWYAQAVELWRGSPAADQPSLRVLPSVVSLSEEWQSLVIEYAGIAAELGVHDELVPLLREAAADDALNEVLHARLMIALAGSGRQAEALWLFDNFRQRLADELGADPSPELLEAHQRVLRQDVGHPPTDSSTTVQVHRQLPPDIIDFTGREDELRAVYQQVFSLEGSSTGVSIVAIEGMAGVGKTRLAVHLAHQLRAQGRYADIQLHVDLRGHADEPPTDPATVLGSFLHLLGVTGDELPQSLDARAALFRDRLHDRQALVLLDNAAGVDQVLPLLPAGSGALVLITSRRSLALDGAYTVPLEEFGNADALALLTKIVGVDRVEADTLAALEVIRLCGRLPLAVALVARRLQGRPSWSFTDVNNRLQETSDRIEELAAGTRRVRAAFGLSYQALDQWPQRLFRRLGLHPGGEFTPASVAALCDVEPVTARHTLDRLADEHLVTAVTGDRYRLHDLLHVYARELVTATDGEDICRASVERQTRWYLYALERARNWLDKHRHSELRLDRHEPAPAHLPTFRSDAEAYHWLETEHAALLAAATQAISWEIPRLTWQLPVALRHYFERIGDWEPWLIVAWRALDAARAADDRWGEALLLGDLGVAYGHTGDIERSIELTTRAADIHGAAGEHAGRSWALNNRAIGLGIRGDLHAAIDTLEQALGLIHHADNPVFTGRLLSNLGHAHSRLGERGKAIGYLERALEIRQSCDDPSGVANTLHGLGQELLSVGQLDRAILVLRKAHDLYRSQHHLLYQAGTLEVLGEALSLVGRPHQARECWQQALTLLEQLPSKDGHRLRERLEQQDSDAAAGGARRPQIHNSSVVGTAPRG